MKKSFFERTESHLFLTVGTENRIFIKNHTYFNLNQIYLFLVKIGWKRLDDNLIHTWFQRHYKEGLFFALENGVYKVRSESARYLGKLKMREAIPLLRKSMESSIMDVSLCASEAYLEIADYHNLVISVELQKDIISNQKKWKSHLMSIKNIQFLNQEFTPMGYEAPWRKLLNNQQSHLSQNKIVIT